MSTTLTAPKPATSALAVMASRFSVDPAKLLQTLKNTVFKGASDDELLALVVVANEYQLNPLTKEIYAFPDKKRGGIVPVVSIDGWINRMNSNAQFDGITFDDAFGQDGKPVSCTATIWRKDRTRPTVVTEYFSECYRNTDPWNGMPCRMMRHKALIQGVRVAFGFGGVYDEDEARDIVMRDVTPTRGGKEVDGPNLAAPAPEQPAPAPTPPRARRQGKAAPAAPQVTGNPLDETDAPQGQETQTAPRHMDTAGDNPNPRNPEFAELPPGVNPAPAPDFSLAESTPHDILRDNMRDNELALCDVRAICARMGLASQFTRIADIPVQVAEKLIGDWDAVLAIKEKGGF